MEISFTRLRIYRECPWKYKLMFIDGMKIPSTPQSAVGLALHRALESFHRANSEDLEFLLERYGREDKGRRFLEKYFEQNRARRTRIIGNEKEFVYPLGPHMVRGMVDRIDQRPDGGIEIIDCKTQLDQKEYPLADNLQLHFYALGVRECLNLKPSWLTVHYLAAGKTDSIAYDDSGEDELKRLIIETAEHIEAGEFRSDSSFCPRCDFRKGCQFSIARD